MTVLVGILAKDGVVIGADTGMTTGDPSGNHVAEHPTSSKLWLLCDRSLIFAHTGETGAGARIAEKLAEHYDKGSKKRSKLPPNAFASWLFEPVRQAAIKDAGFLKQVTTELAEVLKRGATPSQVHAFMSHVEYLRCGAGLAATIEKGVPRLTRFEGMQVQETLSERVPFAVLGSGVSQADPFMGFLRSTLWPADDLPSLEVAMMCACWSIQHCIKHNTGGVAGEPQLAVVRPTSNGSHECAILSSAEMEEVQYHVDDMRKAMRNTADDLMHANVKTGDQVPRPDAVPQVVEAAPLLAADQDTSEQG